jgi:uncharacterized protein
MRPALIDERGELGGRFCKLERAHVLVGVGRSLGRAADPAQCISAVAARPHCGRDRQLVGHVVDVVVADFGDLRLARRALVRHVDARYPTRMVFGYGHRLMMEVVVRPLWREFSPDKLRAAVRHAKDGGLAVVKDQRWKLLGDAGPPGEDLPQLVDWAIRAIESARWAEVVEGPAKGCVEAAITRDWRKRVQEWIDRDRAFSGSTTETSFDCMVCGACCYDNNVVIDEQDVARFREGGRADLLRKLSRRAGLKLLPLVRDKEKPCVHLQKKMCTIYDVRPNMCRDFPVGTEQCITSREDLYGEPFPAGR